MAGGLTLLMAVGVGTGAQTALARRHVATLPLSPKELHRAAWVLAVVLPLAMLTLARGLGGGWHMLVTDGAEWAFHASAVRVVFDGVLLGLVGAWVVMVPEHRESNVPRDSWFLEHWLALRLVGLVTFMVGPFAVIPRLPATMGEVPPALWLLAVALLGLAVAAFIRPPDAYRRATSPAAAPVPSATVSPSNAVAHARFHGAWALLPGLVRRASLLALGMIIFLVFVQQDKDVITIWRPFDPALTTLRFMTTICGPMLMVIGLLPGLGNRLSLLKWLPLSSGRAALILGLAPGATPVIFWMMLLMIHVVFSAQWPGALHLGLLVAFIGAASLVDALGVKTGSSLMKLAIGAPLLLVYAYGMDNHRVLMAAVVEHWSPPLAGLACLGLGVLVNFHSVTRSHRSSRVFRFGRTDLPQGAQ